MLAEFGEERQAAEQEAVRSPLVLLVLDLTETGVTPERRLRGCGSLRFTHVLVVVGVDLLLQQREQLGQPAGEGLPLHLHVQTADLSPEAPQAGLRTHRRSSAAPGNGNA